MSIFIDKLSKAYGRNVVFDGLSLEFKRGESYCLMGTSGCGKTTLLHIMMGLIQPDSGSVKGLEGLKIAPVFQENRLCENLSVGANIRLVCGKSVAGENESVLYALGLPDIIHKPIKELSGGMARRAAIARAICYNGDVYILDEPFKGLDDETKEQVMAYTRESCLGKTVIWVTHDARESDFWGGNIIRF